MVNGTAHKFQIGSPPAVLQSIALEQAFEALPPAERSIAIDELLAAVARGERSLAGLMAAWHDQSLSAAIWTECQAGRTAALWPPRLTEGAPQQLADELLTVALHELQSKQVTMAQSLLLTDAGDDAQRLERAGFEHPCDLLYLVSHAGQFPTSAVASCLTFRQVDPADVAGLARLVEATYEQTLDCPAVDRRRDCLDVLAGYRATSRHDLSHWFIVCSDDEEIGCLLLAEDERHVSWELVYMGLRPAIRGRGWGIELVRYAQWLVRQGGGERLVLAVDAANEPALNIYAAAGFMAWDRRSVFLKFLASGGHQLPSV